MLIINISSQESKEEILDRFSKYEDDVPSAFNPLAEYFDSRIGLHVLIEEDRIKGYYEDGKKNSNGKLMTGKNFFWIRVKECNEGVKLKGMLAFCPFFVLIVLLSELVGLVLRDNQIVWIALVNIGLFVFLKDKLCEEQLEIKRLIKQICQK